ncbi:hypothetical protein P20652_0772 [Pseudoalteromonas sp. BSi20652]|uniref:hypothetical protein n=1 Tax=Pseudoalteromonas sp. BSi20652 TaxID=388384 RepID=UPI000231A0B7|nr:hypothetical protein [Pseudoalteromonas sp. BSi20652]GAA58913.1 hypothetical protein P20652_0772 [Pseudoalteromonas sp. BSi20652]
MTFDVLCHINATGFAASSLYTAVANQMLFSKPSKALIRCDISLDAPYIMVEIDELAQLDRQTKCLLLLSQLLEHIDIPTLRQTSRISQIVFVLPQDELGNPVIDNDTLAELLSEVILQQVPDFNQTTTLDLKSIAPDTLIIALDSCVSYQYVSNQAKNNAVQVLNGPPGIINGEGGYALLTHLQGGLSAQFYSGELNEQLNQAQACVSNTYLFAGKDSLAWQKKWFANTQTLYSPEDELIELANLNNTIGYQGVANAPAGLALANSYLNNPLNKGLQHVFLLFNSSSDQLIKISRSET